MQFVALSIERNSFLETPINGINVAARFERIGVVRRQERGIFFERWKRLRQVALPGVSVGQDVVCFCVAIIKPDALFSGGNGLLVSPLALQEPGGAIADLNVTRELAPRRFE